MKPIWGYRVMRCADGTFEFREVFYDESGEVVRIDPKPAFPKGETRADLLRDLDGMFRAIAAETLDETKTRPGNSD